MHAQHPVHQRPDREALGQGGPREQAVPGASRRVDYQLDCMFQKGQAAPSIR